MPRLTSLAVPTLLALLAGAALLAPADAVVSPSPTPTEEVPPPPPCVGDCDEDGSVTVNELLVGVNIVLGALPEQTCPAFGCRTECAPGPIRLPTVTVACLIQGVANALEGCSAVRCVTDQDCDDGNACSRDQCTAGACTHECLCVFKAVFDESDGAGGQ